MFSARSIKLPDFSGIRLSRLLLGLGLLICVSACSVPQKLRPYSIDIRQGNYVTQEMTAQLTPGMTEEQVRFIMGSPLLVDPFHANRWDYVYRFAKQGKVTDTRHVTLLFKDSKLSSIEGDVIAPVPPASAAPATSATTAPGTQRVAP